MNSPRIPWARISTIVWYICPITLNWRMHKLSTLDKSWRSIADRWKKKELGNQDSRKSYIYICCVWAFCISLTIEEARLKFMEMSDYYGTHQTSNRSFANEFSRIMMEWWFRCERLDHLYHFVSSLEGTRSFTTTVQYSYSGAQRLQTSPTKKEWKCVYHITSSLAHGINYESKS
jgi:hypothetical protein